MRIFEMRGVWCSKGKEGGWAKCCEVENNVEVSLLVDGYYRSLTLAPEQALALADQIRDIAYRIEAAGAKGKKE